MRPTTPEIVLWYSALLLEAILFTLALWRRLHRHLPIFAAYLTFLVAREAFMFAVYHYAGYNSRLGFYSFWITQAILLAARAASIAELAWFASQTYPGFRVILKWLLAGLAFVFLLGLAWVGIANASHIPSFVLGVERNIELAAAAILLTLLSLSIRYEVPLQTSQKLIAAGLLSYSLIQVINNAVSRQWLEAYFHWWDAIRIGSFHVTLLIWLIALAKPLSHVREAAPAVDHRRLREFMRQGTEVIHDLASRLNQFRRKLEK